MNDEELIASALLHFSPVREFQRTFHNSEHTVANAQREFGDGWEAVTELISRAHFHDRYIIWQVVAFKIEVDGAILELEKPQHYFVEVEKVHKLGGDKGGASWDCEVMEFEDDGWKQLMDLGGDFAAVGIELTVDDPVDGFSMCWNGTRPRRCEPSHATALKAPLRYMS